ncbi:MAG: carbohydrate porin [Alteromonadaceae bacterium]|nr:carbohydrate porin [Alteromonadaceae bacterium]
MKKTLIASAVLGLLVSGSVLANQETDDLRKIIAEQQKVLKKLERRLDQTEQRLEMTADQIESTTTHGAALTNSGATKLGGYGEMHYNNIEDKKSISFHRFVLFASHEFTDKLRFFSEFEVEHAVIEEGANGAVELEQAYIEYDYSDKIKTTFGLFLVPVGIINETHEPTAFYGVERNPVEKNIIPTTWWEGGAAVNYRPLGGVSFDFAITSGLNTPIDGNSAYKVRSGRQNVSKANADSLAFTSRVKYTAINGLELAATVQYQQDMTQGAIGVDKADATLFEAHGIYQIENFKLIALYARWDISGDEAKSLGRDEQTGWYVEPSYKFNEKFGVFARYAKYDNNVGNSDDTSKDQTNIGINYYLHENVVLKADWEEQGQPNKNGFNLGIGYQF